MILWLNCQVIIRQWLLCNRVKISQFYKYCFLVWLKSWVFRITLFFFILCFIKLSAGHGYINMAAFLIVSIILSALINYHNIIQCQQRSHNSHPCTEEGVTTEVKTKTLHYKYAHLGNESVCRHHQSLPLWTCSTLAMSFAQFLKCRVFFNIKVKHKLRVESISILKNYFY